MLLQEGKPVSYASRSVTSTEKNYAIIEKELLAVLFGCERFHQYIYGNKTLVESDHKPLESIIKKPLARVPARLQRMLLRLQRYDFQSSYKSGNKMLLADALSRASMKDADLEVSDEELAAQIHMVYSNNEVTGTNLEEVRRATADEHVLPELGEKIQSGWPSRKDEVNNELKQYWSYRDELLIINSIIFIGDRAVIPKKLRPEMLKQLHIPHMGIEKTEFRARESMFWPRVNREIENMVKLCNICIKNQRKEKEPMITTDVAVYPFQIVGTDLFHWDGQNFLLVVDYHSKYWEMERLYSTTSISVIRKMKMMFSRLGIPEIVRSDNGTQYTSGRFKRFAESWGFQHITSSPEYPRSNGMAERYVEMVENMLTK